MKETKHTPGPWKFDDTRKYYQPGCIRNNGHIIAFVSQVGDNSAERTANANLIAAAPEMLATLTSIIEWFEDDHDWPVNGDEKEKLDWHDRKEYRMVQAARSAIAKITGEKGLRGKTVDEIEMTLCEEMRAVLELAVNGIRCEGANEHGHTCGVTYTCVNCKIIKRAAAVIARHGTRG